MVDDLPELAGLDDAVRPPADASYEAQLARPVLSPQDARTASAMIGRPLRGRSAVAVRCGWGLPAVLRVDPALDDGTPFPTTFWLTCPIASKAAGRLEASGVMKDLTQRLRDEPELAEEYRRASERFVAARNQLGPRVPRDDSAGGMPVRVKCLHTLYGHYLATRDNPVGQWVAEQLEPLACPHPCVADADADADVPALRAGRS